MKSYYELKEAITSYTLDVDFSYYEIENSDIEDGRRPDGLPKNYLLNEGMVVCSLRRTIRGAAGGSCWGDEAREYYCDTPFSLTGLERIFEFLEVKCSPDLISEEVYNRVTIAIAADNDYQYYGNYEDFEVLHFNLEELYHYICNMPIYFKYPHPDSTYVRHGLHFVKWQDGTKGHAVWNGKSYDCGRIPVEFSPIPEPR